MKKTYPMFVVCSLLFSIASCKAGVQIDNSSGEDLYVVLAKDSGGGCNLGRFVNLFDAKSREVYGELKKALFVKDVIFSKDVDQIVLSFVEEKVKAAGCSVISKVMILRKSADKTEISTNKGAHDLGNENTDDSAVVICFKALRKIAQATPEDIKEGAGISPYNLGKWSNPRPLAVKVDMNKSKEYGFKTINTGNVPLGKGVTLDGPLQSY